MGPKAAAAMIRTFGTVEQLYETLGLTSGAMAEGRALDLLARCFKERNVRLSASKVLRALQATPLVTVALYKQLVTLE